jgi:hypothetical protein
LQGNLSIANSSSAIALLAKHRCGFEHTLLHITCNGEPKERTLGYVKQALDHGLTNILGWFGFDVHTVFLLPIKILYLINNQKFTKKFPWTKK